MRLLLAAVLLAFGSCASSSSLPKVQFPSFDNNIGPGKASRLDGYLIKPQEGGRHPALVFLHGCGGLFDRDGRIEARELDWARRLTRLGYVVLLVDSFTGRGQGSECGSGGRPVTGSVRQHDAYAASLFLQGMPEVRADRIGLIGWSHGGGSVLYAVRAGGDSRLRDVPHGGFHAAVAFYPGWCNARAQGAKWSSSVPLLILIGENDNWSHPGPCREFAAAAGQHGAPVEIRLYPGAYHDFDWPDLKPHALESLRKSLGFAPIIGTDPVARQDALARVPAFLDRYLRD